MPWFILKELVDTRPLDGTNRPRALCAPDANLALFSVTLRGVEATPQDVKQVDGLHAMKYAHGQVSWDEAQEVIA